MCCSCNGWADLIPNWAGGPHSYDAAHHSWQNCYKPAEVEIDIQVGGDEGLGGGDALGIDQYPGGLVEHTGLVVHRMDDVAVGPAGALVGLAQVADECLAAPAENREPVAQPVGGDGHVKSAGGYGGRPIWPASVVKARPKGGRLRFPRVWRVMHRVVHKFFRARNTTNIQLFLSNRLEKSVDYAPQPVVSLGH
jgi:hypothetical protein